MVNGREIKIPSLRHQRITFANSANLRHIFLGFHAGLADHTAVLAHLSSKEGAFGGCLARWRFRMTFRGGWILVPPLFLPGNVTAFRWEREWECYSIQMRLGMLQHSDGIGNVTASRWEWDFRLITCLLKLHFICRPMFICVKWTANVHLNGLYSKCYYL